MTYSVWNETDNVYASPEPFKTKRAALEFAKAYGTGGVATVVASNLVCGPMEAATTNGVLAHSDETDDSHSPSQSHPGCAVVPAALATGERFSIGGLQFLRAITLGYDIGCRVGMTLGGVNYQTESHRDPHATSAGFGAAAAAGCAATLNAKQVRSLLDYAAQQSAGIAAWQRDTQHMEKSFVFAGMTARNGVTAALLAHDGWSGVNDIFSGITNTNVKKFLYLLLLKKYLEQNIEALRKYLQTTEI